MLLAEKDAVLPELEEKEAVLPEPEEKKAALLTPEHDEEEDDEPTTRPPALPACSLWEPWSPWESRLLAQATHVAAPAETLVLQPQTPDATLQDDEPGTPPLKAESDDE